MPFTWPADVSRAPNISESEILEYANEVRRLVAEHRGRYYPCPQPTQRAVEQAVIEEARRWGILVDGVPVGALSTGVRKVAEKLAGVVFYDLHESKAVYLSKIVSRYAHTTHRGRNIRRGHRAEYGRDNYWEDR